MERMLYAHNEKAYQAAAAMLAETGKAAVIHPTGTGKSFIGLQLCADLPKERICWLSPSEHIFHTQLENWERAGGKKLENLCFLTYAKLMQLKTGELTELAPTYLVLDEFHRCGAEQWGGGVARLLAQYPQARVLGLSATNIRYLDNQRDMAWELFDGNIASEMSLGEVIARGILQPPKYVLTAFSLQKDLERYEKRIRGAKGKAVQDQGWELLEALRRALEQADGLDEVFRRHMTERKGKYIVFCANVKHMEEMRAHVPEWFGKIDAQPHVYCAYADDPAASKAFREFKEDGSAHLRLLFCIDMLNEGVHVEDINGVILFRPTVSPIIYKQQIGRALSAGKEKEPVIFDVVNNIENLYSIGTVTREMEEAALYFRFHGRGKEIVNERFRVIDELQDCRRLFSRLEETLSASWELMYGQAKKYYMSHGDLNVTRRYKTEEGYALGNWLQTQRKVRSGRQGGSLSRERIAKLDEIGMCWDDKHTASWNRYYAALCIYKQQNGDVDIPVEYVTEDGIRLGSFISNLRTAYSAGRNNGYLTKERLERLEGLGMIWDKADHLWEQNYAACAAYYRGHHDLDIPVKYESADGLKIGAWIRRQRRQKQGQGRSMLTEEQVRRLEAIGMQWNDAYERKWEHGYERAKAYYETHGDLMVPPGYIDEEGFPLGKWLRRHTEVNRKTGKTGIQVTAERKAKLEAIGMQWEKGEDAWERRYRLAKAYYEAHGHLRIPLEYKPEGIWLNKWVNEQKQIYRGRRAGKALSAEQIAKLIDIGIAWDRPGDPVPAVQNWARL